MEAHTTKFQHDSVKSALQHRKSQFVDRHGWALSVTPLGEEIDCYDTDEADYVSVAGEDESVLLSCRVRAASFGTMVEDFFSDTFGLGQSAADLLEGTWELTRFCKDPELGVSSCRRALRVIRDALEAKQRREGHRGYVAVVFSPVLRLMEMNGLRPVRLRSGTIDGQDAWLIAIDLVNADARETAIADRCRALVDQNLDRAPAREAA